MKLFPPARAKCPHCQSLVDIKDLEKVPSPASPELDSLVSPQPDPGLACPRCHQLVEYVTGWEWSVFAVFYFLVYMLAFMFNPCHGRFSSWIIGSLGILIYPLCLKLSTRSGYLLPDRSCENRKDFEKPVIMGLLIGSFPIICLGIIALLSYTFIHAQNYCHR